MQRRQFEGRSKYSTWVHGVAIRTCLMQRRGYGRRRKHEQKAQEFEADRRARSESSNSQDASIDLAKILETLDEEDRALLILKYSEGHNYEELSDMFELSVSACKMRIKRAREKLQQRFPEFSFGEAED
jgi:RNA polymerase sigma-70 factor (ECF subfamily)